MAVLGADCKSYGARYCRYVSTVIDPQLVLATTAACVLRVVIHNVSQTNIVCERGVTCIVCSFDGTDIQIGKYLYSFYYGRLDLSRWRRNQSSLYGFGSQYVMYNDY